jgi:hypothetical protein
MEQHCAGLDPIWYVGAGEAPDYRYCGAGRVVEAGALCVSRNRALDDAHQAGVACLQLSDDLRGVARTTGTTRADVTPIPLADAVRELQEAMDQAGAHLAGVAPTANPFYSRQRVHNRGFIVGDMCLVAWGCHLRWDELLPLKEDYDYTCQHLASYGAVARVDWLLASFAHRTNKGGAVAVRTHELEQQAIGRLLQKWPGHIKPNPRRPDEVLLRWQPKLASPGLDIR